MVDKECQTGVDEPRQEQPSLTGSHQHRSDHQTYTWGTSKVASLEQLHRTLTAVRNLTAGIAKMPITIAWQPEAGRVRASEPQQSYRFNNVPLLDYAIAPKQF